MGGAEDTYRGHSSAFGTLMLFKYSKNLGILVTLLPRWWRIFGAGLPATLALLTPGQGGAGGRAGRGGQAGKGRWRGFLSLVIHISQISQIKC